MTLQDTDRPHARDAMPPSAAGASRPANPRPPNQQEAQIVVQCERANFADATNLILHLYSDEVRGFLRARTHNRASMEEVYSVFSEDVWKGLPKTRFHGQVRGWVYALARNALARHARFKARWRSRHAAAEIDELGSELRQSFTPQRGDLSRCEPLLAGLSAADRSLLEQRLVQSMAWREIAIERAHEGGQRSDADLERESARLRKRFQLLVEELRKRVAQARPQDGS